MKVETIPARQLSDDLRSIWLSILEEQPVLNSPFVHPTFSQIVGEARNDAEIAVVRQGNEIAGFLPYQRTKWNVGQPIGSRMNNFQAVIAKRDTRLDLKQIVRGSGLTAWKYDELRLGTNLTAPKHLSVVDNLYIDLSDGYDAYYKSRRASGSNRLKQAEKFSRRAERDFGQVRCQFDTREEGVLQALLEWKSQQYRNTGGVDILSYAWTVEVIRRALERFESGFSAVVSSLHFGDTLAAVELGLRFGKVLYGWFPAYNREFSKYSPGTVLQLKLAQLAHDEGVHILDMGKANMPYKVSFASGSFPVARGISTAHPIAAMADCSLRLARSCSQSSLLAKPYAKIADWIRPLRTRDAFR